MYKNKLTPEEALREIKLRMNYDSRKTLSENSEEFKEDVIGREERKDIQRIDPGGSHLTKADKASMVTAPPPKKEEVKTPPKKEEVKTPPVKEKVNVAPVPVPKELGGNIEGVQKFQDWLDKNHPGWHDKYQTLNSDVAKGYGKYGPRTTKAWAQYKDEYLKKPEVTPPPPVDAEEGGTEEVYGDDPKNILANN